MKKTILSAGHNMALLRVRNAVIQQAGYAVISSHESAMVLQLLMRADVGAVVLCNSMPAALRLDLARKIKQIKPALPLVILYSDAEQAQFQGLTDHLVPSVHGFAQPLIEALTMAAGEPVGEEMSAD